MFHLSCTATNYITYNLQADNDTSIKTILKYFDIDHFDSCVSDKNYLSKIVGLYQRVENT